MTGVGKALTEQKHGNIHGASFPGIGLQELGSDTHPFLRGRALVGLRPVLLDMVVPCHRGARSYPGGTSVMSGTHRDPP